VTPTPPGRFTVTPSKRAGLLADGSGDTPDKSGERSGSGGGGLASSNGKEQIVIECSTLPLEAKERGHALAGPDTSARLPGERHRRRCAALEKLAGIERKG